MLQAFNRSRSTAAVPANAATSVENSSDEILVERIAVTTRGVHKPGVTMLTSCLLGSFRTQPDTRQEFLSAINLKGGS